MRDVKGSIPEQARIYYIFGVYIEVDVLLHECMQSMLVLSQGIVIFS